MNYKIIYEKLIHRGKNRTFLDNEYFEKHHIIPRCMGGKDDPDNVVKLTPEEHYVAHLLLVKIYDNYSLVYAATMMTVTSDNQNRNNKLYGWLRRKMQLAAKTRTGHNNSMYGRRWITNGHENRSIDIDTAIPDNWRLGRVMPILKEQRSNKPKKIWTAAERAKMSAIKKGKTGQTPWNKGKTGLQTPWNKDIKSGPQVKVCCPHCDIIGGIGNMKRYHFDNCKHKL
jgi:hypothetical protein